MNIPKINYKEIFNAWKISFNPTPTQEELAKLRFEICLKCEFKKEVVKGVMWSALCGKCGCPLNKKVFSPNYNACPAKKWDKVDSNYLEPKPEKNKNTII